MVGVTIGINPVYKSLAKLSALCLQEMTGLDVIILGEKEILKSNLIHPAALKLKIFDLLNDDNIFYFDADWFCIQRWNPLEYENTESITACNDFVLIDDWPKQYADYDLEKFENYPSSSLSFCSIQNIRQDYLKEINQFSGIEMNCLDWINTGFWIANRIYHVEWLNKSLEFYNGKVGHHNQYYEQPAMNKAIEMLCLKVNYLNRKYNTLVATGYNWPASLIGLHVKIKHHQNFVDRVLSGEIKSTLQVREYFVK